MDKPYVYVFVRVDIPLADQGVQIGHASLDAGKVFQHPSRTNMVLLKVKDHRELLRIAKRLDNLDIQYRMFYEPDDGMAETAIATEVIWADQRRHFMHYQLWNPEGGYYHEQEAT